MLCLYINVSMVAYKKVLPDEFFMNEVFFSLLFPQRETKQVGVGRQEGRN